MSFGRRRGRGVAALVSVMAVDGGVVVQLARNAGVPISSA
jgi:hypothetical protein